MSASESAGKLTLTFSEPVSPIGQAVRVYGPDGRRADRGRTTHPAAMSLSVAVDDRRQGTYLVLWQVVASDTHPGRGSTTFSVGTPGPVPQVGEPAADVGGVSPLGLALQALARWLHFAGLVLGFGFVLCMLLRGRAAGIRRVAGIAVLLLAAAEAVWLAAQAASLGAYDEQSLADIVGSPAGRALGLRLGGALALWALLGIEGRPRARGWAIVGLGAALALVDGGTAHALRGLPAAAGILLNAVHVGGMAVWLGAVAGVTLGPLKAAEVARPALAGAAAAVASGVLLALAHIPSIAGLAGTDYGLVLMLKVLVVGLALTLGALSWRTRRPAGLETGALAAVIVAAAVLVSLPPPR